MVTPNHRAALDSRHTLCFHVGHQWPVASERGRPPSMP
jgi:hypothetical protein